MLSFLAHCFNDFHRFNSWTNVVNTEDVGSFHEGDSVQDRCTIKTFICCYAQKLMNHTFAADTNEQGKSHYLQSFHHTQQGVITVYGSFAKAKAWVEDDIVQAQLEELPMRSVK